MTRIDRRIRELMVLFAGALAVSAFAPWGWYPFAILSLALLFNQWLEDTPRRAMLHGALFGAGFFGVGVSWVLVSVHTHGHVPLPAAAFVTLLFVCVLSLYPALLGYFVRRLGRARAGLISLLVFAAGWIVFEWLRGWLFTGFPWLNIGSSQVDSLLAAYAPVAGVYGVGLAVSLTAALLVAVVRKRRRLPALFGILLVWGAAFFLDRTEWTAPLDGRLEVALVQGNIPQEEKWRDDNVQSTLAQYTRLTFSVPGVDLVVWPETAIPAFYHQVETGFIPALESRLREHDMSLLTGIPLLDRGVWKYYNSVASIGDERGFYFKRHLVPFGEYLPFRSVIGAGLDALAVPNADFTPGNDRQALLEAAGYPVGASICFEVAFSEEIAKALPQAALLVNVSNDAWFGDSLAPHQHLEMARIRAMETGRPMLRATNTGISAIIGHDGRILARSAQFESTVVTGSVVPRGGATPYVRFGNAPVVLLCAGLLLAVWLRRWLRT